MLDSTGTSPVVESHEDSDVVKKALELYIGLSLGRLDLVSKHLNELLMTELALDHKTKIKIDKLLAEANDVFWRNRYKWTVFERKSLPLWIAYKIYNEIIGKKEEVERTKTKIEELKKFLSSLSN